MGEELVGLVLCCCQLGCEACKAMDSSSCNTEMCQKCLCCVCQVCEGDNIRGLEKCIGACCEACCNCSRVSANLCLRCCCSNTYEGQLIYWNCGNSGGCGRCGKCGKCPKCKFSCIVLCLALLTLYSVCIGIVCFVTAYHFGDNQCNTPLDTHVVVQGIFWLGNAFVFMHLCFKYYLPADITFPNPEKAAFSRFHGLFAKDVFLSLLLGGVSLGFWWSILGYYWLSKSTCDVQDAFLITMDSFAVGNEFIMIIIFILLVYILLCIVACDEGSCKFEQFQVDGFLCCCDLCLKKPEGFDQRRMKRWQEARQKYPEKRNACLNAAVSTILFFGCVRPAYRMSRSNSSFLIASGDDTHNHPPNPPEVPTADRGRRNPLEVFSPEDHALVSDLPINVSAIVIETEPVVQTPIPSEEVQNPKASEDN